MRYLLKILLLFPFFFHNNDLMGRQLWIFKTTTGLEEYLEINSINDTIYGNYFGHFIGHDSLIVYFKAPIVLIEGKADKFRFKIESYLYSYETISPFSPKDSSLYFDMEEARRRNINRAPLLFQGYIVNDKLSLKKSMIYGGSNFDKLEFEKVDSFE